jgi:hypothetical protein
MQNLGGKFQRLQRFLTALWLVLVSLLIFGGVNFLVVLKTGIPLLGLVEGMGVRLPESLTSSPWTYFILAGDVVPGYLDFAGNSGLALLSMLIWLGVTLLGGVCLYRLALRSGAGEKQPRAGTANLTRWVVVIGAGMLTAGVLAAVLEVLGLWQKLALHADPYQEKGAPFWLWWMVAAAAIALGHLLLRKRIAAGSMPAWVKRLFILALGSFLTGTASLLCHVARPEPTQGRYYGIQGFVVGRAQNYEYGTYYGMVAGTIVLMLALVQIAWLLLVAVRIDSSRMMTAKTT